MILTVLAAALAFLQPDAIQVEWGLQPGVSYEFRVHQSRVAGAEVVKNGEATLFMSYRVDPDGTRVLRTTQESTGLTAADAKKVGLTLDDLHTTCEYVLDDNYGIVELRNWEELRAAAKSMTNRMMDARVKNGEISAENAAKVLTIMTGQFDSHDSLLLMHSKFVSPYLNGYGRELVAGEPRSAAITLPNPLGGKPLPATITIELDDDPETPELLEFSQAQTLDPDGVRDLAMAVLGQVAPDAQAEIAAAMEQVEVSDSFFWAYDPEHHLIRDGRFGRRMQLPDQPLIFETWKWELVAESKSSE